MADALNIIFSSFWTFIGTVILIGCVGQALAVVILALGEFARARK